jgi:glutamate/tyrosine decarboxylase-like PLP-dependent enzyme
MILDAELLARTLEHAEAFLASLPERPVAPAVDLDALRKALRRGLTDGSVPARTVIDELVEATGPGLVASAGPRYFGFVTGGSLPAALAADWLASAWDQNGALHVMSPAASIVEEVVEGWVLDVLGLPDRASVGVVTGAQMANFSCLAAARDETLRRAGWDAAADGLNGSPPLAILVGAEAHTTIFRALRMLGLGARTPRLIPADGQGAMDPGALARELEGIDGPAIVCAQAGNVNTGAFDPLEPIAEACRAAGAWLHVDGAFGLWAAASPRRSALVAGVERADSWAVDAHKWLNVPYDSGLAIVADREAHERSLSMTAAYLVTSGLRESAYRVPESSRRARGFALYAALRQLGRDGLAELVDRCCEHARHFARLLAAGGAEILNDVVLNQVLVAFGDRTEEVLARVQPEGTLWAGGSVWHGRPAIRISVSGWATTSADVERSAAAILNAAATGP